MSCTSLQRHFVLILGILILGSSSSLAAQSKHASSEGLAVDVIVLKSGRNLRGAIVSQLPNGAVTMAVSREWLSHANPMLEATTLKENLEGRKSGWVQTRDRIVELEKSAKDSPHLAFFLKQERERLDHLIADPGPDSPDFLWIDVRPESIAKVHRATPERTRIATLAWDDRLTHVETRDANSLQKELTQRGMTLETPAPDLSDRLPARLQSPEEWAARLALIDYALVKSLDFQGMGQTLAEIRDGQPANLGEILPKLLQQQLTSLLGELTNDRPLPNKAKADSEWLAGAIRTAERDLARGFRVTRLELDPVLSTVTVETRFVAQIAAGQWKTIWLTRESADGSKERPQAEARIEQDPQFKTVTDSLKSLGLSDSQSWKRAVRIGAATMSAQQGADAAFAAFRDRYTRHLDGPPLRTNPGP